MNGDIAQIIALTCFGNAFLSGKKIESLFFQNSTFSRCNRVAFVFLEQSTSGKLIEEEVAGSPEEWFDYLKSINALGIRLSCTPRNDPDIPDRMSVAFVNGGRTWKMKVILTSKQSESWISRWRHEGKSTSDNRIYRVTYGRTSTGETFDSERINLTDIRAHLKKALLDIHAFSERLYCERFIKTFDDALITLDSKEQAFHGHYKDLAPEGFLSDEAISTIDACQIAWVFGGMLSWNDMWFEEADVKEQYNRVSDQLFDAIHMAIAAGVNSTHNQSL